MASTNWKTTTESEPRPNGVGDGGAGEEESMTDRVTRLGGIVCRMAETLAESVAALRGWQGNVSERLDLDDQADLEAALIGLETALLAAELTADVIGGGR